MTYQPPKKMPPGQALALAALLIDFEIEQPQVNPPPPGWQMELKQARQALEELQAALSPKPQEAPQDLQPAESPQNAK